MFCIRCFNMFDLQNLSLNFTHFRYLIGYKDTNDGFTSFDMKSKYIMDKIRKIFKKLGINILINRNGNITYDGHEININDIIYDDSTNGNEITSYDLDMDNNNPFKKTEKMKLQLNELTELNMNLKKKYNSKKSLIYDNESTIKELKN